MQIDPYLFFDGNCEEALTAYAKLLGGTIEAMMPHEGTPAAEHVSPEWQKKILHARLTFGDQVLMASDAPPGRYSKPQGFTVSVTLKEKGEAERIFKALAEKGAVMMPFEPTFFSPGFGMLTDRFGIPWMVSCAAEPQVRVGAEAA